MQINLLDKNTVAAILADVESQQNKDRKRLEWEAFQCTQGDLRQYVIQKLKALFPKNYVKMRVSDISISKKVIDKVAKAYSMAPIRTVEASEPVKQELESVYKDGKFNTAYRDFDSVFNLHRYGLFWVDYNLEKQQFRPIALHPYEFDTIRDQKTGDVICVILNYPDNEITKWNNYSQVDPYGNNYTISDGINQIISENQADSGAESKVFALWTNEQHVIVVLKKKEIKTASNTEYNYAITYVPLPGNADMINPLGELPFVYLQKGSSIDYPTMNQITAQTINFNILYSDLLTAATMQGFGQAVISYPDNAEIKEVEIGYMNAVKLPQSTEPDAPKTEFKFENPSPNLEGQKDVYLTYIKQVLAEHGVTASQAISGDVEQFASGLDRLIANSDVHWIIQENQELYQNLEQDVFNKIKAWNRLLGNNIFEPVDSINVYYPKPTVQISDTEKLQNIEKLITLRLKTRAQGLMMIDPNLTKEQAEAEIAAIDSGAQKTLAALNG